jgi:DNA processing protein
MSGLSLATVIVEASEASGTRVQARSALSQGRLLLLMPGVLGNDWARDLAGRGGVEVLDRADAVVGALERHRSMAV